MTMMTFRRKLLGAVLPQDLTGYGVSAGKLSITLPTVPLSRPAIFYIYIYLAD